MREYPRVYIVYIVYRVDGPPQAGFYNLNEAEQWRDEMIAYQKSRHTHSKLDWDKQYFIIPIDVK